MKAMLTQQEAIERAIARHGDRYSYEDSVYHGSLVEMEIECSIHGKFMQKAVEHLRGKGCQLCGKESNNLSAKGNFIRNFKTIHGNKYDYEKFIYIDDKTKGVIVCKKHGEFLQKPNDHKNGNGCPSCKNGSLKLICYYAAIFHGEKTYFKIGVTGKSVTERLKQVSHAEIKIWEFENNNDAFAFERKVLEEHKEFQYHGNFQILRCGDSELFTIDVLNLYKQNQKEIK